MDGLERDLVSPPPGKWARPSSGTEPSAWFGTCSATTNHLGGSTSSSCLAARCSMRPMSPSRPNSERFSTGETSPDDPVPTGPAQVGLVLIRAYKAVFSPWFAGSCRFVPGCADYTSEAVARFGILRGGWLGAKRLCRCHPLGGHGYDPVPQRHPH